MSNKIIYIMSLSKDIEYWNEKLNSFINKYFDSPWAGALLLFVLFAFCWCGMNSIGNKK